MQNIRHVLLTFGTMWASSPTTMAKPFFNLRGERCPHRPRSAHNLLYFRSLAAATQQQRRYYISYPLHRTYRRVGRTSQAPRCGARQGILKPQVLAAFFAYFLPLLSKSMPLETYQPYIAPTIILPAESCLYIPHGILEIQPARGVFSPAPVSPQLPMSRQKRPDMKGRTKR